MNGEDFESFLSTPEWTDANQQALEMLEVLNSGVVKLNYDEFLAASYFMVNTSQAFVSICIRVSAKFSNFLYGCGLVFGTSTVSALWVCPSEYHNGPNSYQD